MAEIAPFALKPKSFLATFDPTGRAAELPRLNRALTFSTTLETSGYRIAIACSDADMLTVDADGQRSLIFAGQLFRPQSSDPGQTLLDRYARLGQDFVRDINGNFTALLIDPHDGQILLATDRANTYKLLAKWDGERLIVANAIDLLPLRGAPLDRTAIAAYLSMSYIYNQRTPFADVTLLDGASVYSLRGGQLQPHKYWQFVFQPDASASPEALSEEFGQRLVEAVRLRVMPDRPTFISLSGGYDSPGILSILAETLRVPDVRCISYAYGESLPGSDEAVSARLAAHYGYRHQIIPAFDGGVVTTLQRSGRLGAGMTRPADEVDAWLRLGSERTGDLPPVMFTGTTHLHKPDWEIRTVTDAVASAHMFDFSLLSWLEPFIGRAAYRDALAATRAEIDRAVQRVPATSDGWDMRDMLRYDQIHSRQALTWREYFTGRFFVPANPLLDDDLVDFLLRVPSRLRRGRRIYINTIRAMFPEQFALPRATTASYSTFWSQSFEQQKDSLRAFIRMQSSPLDDIIAPDILLSLLDADSAAFTRSNARAWALATRAYRLLKKAHWHQSPLLRPSYLKPMVSPTTFLVRALSLRSFLAEANAVPSASEMLR